MSDPKRQQQPIFPGPCPIDPELGIPVCPPPTEIDIIKVKKVFNECMHSQVEEVVIDVDKFICKITTQAQEVECLSATASNVNCQVLDQNIVRVTFDLEVCTSIPLDTGGFEIVCETREISKTFRIDRAGENGLNVQCHVFPTCLFCFISRRDKCMCIFDNFVEEAFQNLPDNEVKRNFLNLYNQYSPLIAQIIRVRPDLSLKAYKLFSKYSPLIQYCINENYGHDMQIKEENIVKIVPFIEELKNEIKRANLDKTPEGDNLVALFNQFTELNRYEGQSLASLLKNNNVTHQINGKVGTTSQNSIQCIKPIGVKEVTCCVGVLILIKVDSEVQLLIPTYGYPAPPPECGEFLGECPTDFTPEWPPYPPQTGFGGGGTSGCKECK
ncbi:MAG: hypothetical protein JM58_10520 [Peptococcaceae bacterium BICA1-8]|nr:MAG: hypothetical protein JM58_10520 [Peptococcaceae bacterium BICA1-8]